MKNSTARKAPLAEWLETSDDHTGTEQSMAPTPTPAMTRPMHIIVMFWAAVWRIAPSSAQRQPKTTALIRPQRSAREPAPRAPINVPM